MLKLCQMDQDKSTELVGEQTIISKQAPQETQRRDDRVTEKRYVPPIIQEEFSEEENIAEVTAWVEDLNEYSRGHCLGRRS